MSRRLAAVVVGCLVAAAVAPGLAGGAAAPAADRASAAVIPVSECRLITEPGHYRLTTDIVDSTANRCINIQASDVVFDGAGHTIDGVGKHLFTTNEGIETATKGVLAKDGPNTNVTVKNVVVTDFGYGMWYGETSDGCIMNNTFRDNGIYGLYVGYGADDNLIVDNVVRDIRSPDPDLYGKGIVVANAAHGSHIEGNDVRSIEQFGIEIATSNDTTVVNNTVVGAGSHGITVSNEGNVVRGNVVSDSGEAGINARQSPGVVIADNVVEDGRDGIALAFSDGAVIRENVVRGNDRYGVQFHGGIVEPWGDHASPGSTVAHNTVVDNGAVGIFLPLNNNDTTVEANLVRANGEAGIRLERNRDTRLVNNTLADQPVGVVIAGAEAAILERDRFGEHAERALLSRHHASPVTVDGASFGDGTTVAAVGRNVALASSSMPPGPLPEGVRPVGRFLRVWPEAGERSWIALSVAVEGASPDPAEGLSVWLYDGDWTRRDAAGDAGTDRFRVNLTALDGPRVVVLAAGAEPTPTTARQPSPTAASPAPTRTPTATPGQPGLGFGVAAVAVVGAAVLARRRRA